MKLIEADVGMDSIMLSGAYVNPLTPELREKINTNANLCDILMDTGFLPAFRAGVSLVRD